MNRYPITFYNAVWLILFATLFISFSWWVLGVVVFFCPTWQHGREWYDNKKLYEQRISELNAASGESDLSDD